MVFPAFGETITSSISRRIRMDTAGLEGVECGLILRSYKRLKGNAEEGGLRKSAGYREQSVRSKIRSLYVKGHSVLMGRESLLHRAPPRCGLTSIVMHTLACALAAAPSSPAFGAADEARWSAEAARVQIARDDWGIAHVRGKMDADAGWPNLATPPADQSQLSGGAVMFCTE